MVLTPMETVVMILAVAAGTQLTRWLPFWLFPENKEPPALVHDMEKTARPARLKSGKNEEGRGRRNPASAS